MKRIFVSTSLFDRQWTDLGLTEFERFDLEIRLLQNPAIGIVIPGCHGLRKLRLPINKKGSRGGGRIIYIDFSRYGRIYLMSIYSKATKVDLSAAEKDDLNQIIRRIELTIESKRPKSETDIE